MKRRTLYIVNAVIALLAAVLWLLPHTERINDTLAAVAFLEGEAAGTTTIAVDITQEDYLFRAKEISGTITIDADSAEPIVYEVTRYGPFDTFKWGSMISWRSDLNTFDTKEIFATADDRLMVLGTSEYMDRYSYIAFNGSYEDASAAFTELTSRIDLSNFGFTENPFK